MTYERLPVTCCNCGAELPDDSDRYGSVGQEICFLCWCREEPEHETWYGLAPHSHDLELTGSFIGSTVYSKLPEPDGDGRYEIQPGLFFTPDIEGGDTGIWEDER